MSTLSAHRSGCKRRRCRSRRSRRSQLSRHPHHTLSSQKKLRRQIKNQRSESAESKCRLRHCCNRRRAHSSRTTRSRTRRRTQSPTWSPPTCRLHSSSLISKSSLLENVIISQECSTWSGFMLRGMYVCFME